MCAELELQGGVKFKPQSIPGRAAKLFASLGAAIPAVNAAGLNAQIAPMKIQLSRVSPGGLLNCHRADVLLFSSLHLCSWGTARLTYPPKMPVVIEQSQFHLGVPTATLRLVPAYCHSSAEGYGAQIKSSVYR